ncbi:MAG: YraN family protein, partial [Candidatus Blackburnbacteria bacterium]|nr:YraN family protein [Candidatus Blackburnbacteria bacterium]
MVTTVRAGKLGEDAAIKLLRREGYKILDRNFRSRFGEIDIVAR